MTGTPEVPAGHTSPFPGRLWTPPSPCVSVSPPPPAPPSNTLPQTQAGADVHDHTHRQKGAETRAAVTNTGPPRHRRAERHVSTHGPTWTHPCTRVHVSRGTCEPMHTSQAAGINTRTHSPHSFPGNPAAPPTCWVRAKPQSRTQTHSHLRGPRVTES